MGILVSRISYYGLEGQGKEYVITDWTKLTIKRGLDTTSNTVDIQLKNSINRLLADGSVLHRYVGDDKELSIDGSHPLQQGDVVKIWLRWADSASDTITYNDSSSHLITISEVQEWEGALEEGKTFLKIKCVDKTYEVLNKLWASAYRVSDGLNAPEIAIRVIQHATDGSKNGYDGSGTYFSYGDSLFGVDARLMSGTYAQQATLDSAATGDPPAYVESLRIDETAYPDIAMTKVWKPVYEWLKELNDITNTNLSSDISAGTPPQDRNNRFYIDQRNRYHQFYPADSINYDITAGTVDPDGSVTSFKMTKKTFDIINMVIFNAGKDLDNVGILWYYYDRTSKERKLKMKYIPMLNIASEGNGSLRQAEATLGNITINSDTTVTIDVASGTTSWGEAYTDEADYKAKFRLYARTLGKSKAKALTFNRGNPRWKGNVDIKKGAYYTPGQLTRFTALTHGINQQLVRIQDVTHQITPNQWVSQLDLEEDEPKYGETA